MKGTGEESAAQAYRSAAEVPHGGALLHDEAIANLERAIEIEPKNSRDLWSVAKWLILAGRVPDAQSPHRFGDRARSRLGGSELRCSGAPAICGRALRRGCRNPRKVRRRPSL